MKGPPPILILAAGCAGILGAGFTESFLMAMLSFASGVMWFHIAIEDYTKRSKE